MTIDTDLLTAPSLRGKAKPRSRRLFSSKLPVILFFGSIITLGQSTSLFAITDIPDDVLAGVAEHTTVLLEKYPASKYFVLNMGITATISSAFLQQFIPNSQQANSYFRDITVTRLKQVRQLYPTKRKDFFDRIIPPQEVLGTRTLVLNRVLWAGETMMAFLPFLIEYLQEYRPGVAVTYHWLIQPDIAWKIDNFQQLDRSEKTLLPGTVSTNRKVVQYHIEVMYEDNNNRDELTKYQKYLELTPHEVADLAAGEWPEQKPDKALVEHINKAFPLSGCKGISALIHQHPSKR